MVKKGKYITVGIGTSKIKDSYDAAIEASKEALVEAGGKNSFAIVYTSSDLDQKRILNGINEVLGREWVGVSTDKMFSSKDGYDPNLTVSVLVLNTEYMHFSVSVSDNYKKHPQKSGYKAAEDAISRMKADKHLDAYVEFTRMKKKDYRSIIRNPHYFILTYISGAKVKDGKEIPGREFDFLSGIIDFTGINIPIFGGSASSSFEDYFEGIADNVQFANGKLYEDAAIVVFAVSNLHFRTNVGHGYGLTSNFAVVTKLDESGFDILELNHNEPVDEYCSILKINKQDYLKDPSKYSLSNPFGFVMEDGSSFVKEALPRSDGKTMHSTFKLHQYQVLNILDYNEKKTLNTLKTSVEKIAEKSMLKHASVSLFCNCSGRRPLLTDIEVKDLAVLNKYNKRLNYFGFYSFGEIGTTAVSTPHLHSQTVTSLMIFDKLLTE